MGGLALFRKMTVDQAARWLEVHPFDIVRLLVSDDQLPVDLRLDPFHVERVRVRGGLETWWEVVPTAVPGEPRARTLARMLIAAMVERDVVEPRYTRADNLFRGLDGESQVVLRRAVNALIKEQLLSSRMAAEGLTVTIPGSAVQDLHRFAQGKSRLLDPVWATL